MSDVKTLFQRIDIKRPPALGSKKRFTFFTLTITPSLFFAVEIATLWLFRLDRMVENLLLSATLALAIGTILGKEVGQILERDTNYLAFHKHLQDLMDLTTTTINATQQAIVQHEIQEKTEAFFRGIFG